MRDLVGNTLAEGQLVLWRPAGMSTGGGLMGTIIHIEEPTLTAPGVDDRPAQLVIAVPVSVVAPHGQSLATLRLDEIIRVVDPKQQGALEAILAGRGGVKQ